MEFFKLRWKIFLAFILVVCGLLLATLFVSNTVIDAQSDDTIRVELQGTNAVFDGLLKERRSSLRAQIRVLSESTEMKAALDTGKRAQDPATVKDTAINLNSELRLAIFQVAGKNGSLLASLMGKEAPDLPKPPKNAKAADVYFEKAVDRNTLGVTEGAWASKDTLFETITGPVFIQDNVLGALRIGFAMDDAFAKTLKGQTGSEVAILVGGKVYASSLDGVERDELVAALNSMMGKAEKASAGGIFDASLSGSPYLGQFIDILGPDGAKAAELLQLRSKARVLLLLSSLRKNFLMIFISGLIVSLLVAFFVSRNINKPLDSLIAATRQVDKGNLDLHVQVDTRDELGELADSFNTMVKDLKEKERVKGLFGRYLPKAVADKVMAQQGELQLGGEQKDVAILFSDIRGFTAISERMSPTELVSMLNDYYTRMIDVLFDNGGTLDKTIGDAIMAVFGAPVTDADAAGKAVHTALQMQEALKGFNAERRAKSLEPFEIGIGINTGVVVAGNLGSTKQFSYTVIGDEVNLASRMCSVAKKGQIIITEATYRKVKWQFEFNRLEPVMVKNVSQPVQIYEVLGVKKDATGA
jgi:class 3 adenylate cyclase